MAICPSCEKELLTPAECPSCGWKQTSIEISQGSQEKSVDVPVQRETQNPMTGSGTEIKQSAEIKGDGSTLQIAGNVAVSIGRQVISGKAKEKNKLKSKTLSYVEITEEFSLNRDRFPQLTFSSAIDRYYDTLRRENIVLINCYDQDVSDAALCAIVDRIKLEDKYKRFLDFHKMDVDPTSITIDLFLKNKSISETFEIIVIDGRGDNSQTFFESLFNGSRLRSEPIKKRLKDNKFFLICILKPSYIQERFKSKKERPDFAFWDVPYLEARLQELFPNDHREIDTEIHQQRERGLWSSDDAEFYNDFVDCLSSDKLQEEIEKRKQLKNGRELAQLVTESSDINALSLFKDDDPLKKVVLYVAAYFSELSPSDFFRIVSLLLGEKTATFTTSTQLKTKKGKIKQIEQQEEKRLMEIWQNNPDKILKECCLKTSQLNSSVRIITFASPYLRKEIISLFEQESSIFLVNQFNNLMRLGLLFHPSEKVTNNVIDLAVEMALSYPEQYGKDWLTQMIVAITHQLHMEVDPNVSLEELFKQIWEKIELENLKRFVYIRITKLLRKLLAHNQLQSTAIGFLNQLFEWQHHQMLFDIVKHLRFVESFNMYSWLKRLIDESRKEVQDSVFKYLLQQADSCDHHSLFLLLQTINSWLPEKEKENYSPSNRLALRFLIEYSAYTIRLLEFDLYGQYPSQYSLFTEFEESSAKERFKFLFDWLFHEGMPTVLKEEEHDLIDALLTEWYLIINGFAKEPKDKKIADILNIFVEVLGSAATKAKTQKALLSYWSNLSEGLLNTISSPGDISLLEIKRLKSEWSLLRLLRKQFKNLVTAK